MMQVEACILRKNLQIQINANNIISFSFQTVNFKLDNQIYYNLLFK